MPNNWTTYRLLCCSTPELEAERTAFNAANSKFAERVSMPLWILFALASPRDGFDAQVHKSAIESNLRICDFFLQIFGETASHPVYAGFVDFAAACTADPSVPMRSFVVAFRNPEQATPEIAALRRRLASTGCDVRDFHNSREFDELAGQVLADWFDSVKPLANSSRA